MRIIRLITSLTFLSLILVLPLVFVPNIFNSYEFPKFTFFIAAVEILSIFFALFWLKSANKKVAFPKLDLGAKLVLCFGIINLVSDLLGPNPKTSILGNIFRHQGFITLLAGIILFILLRSSFLQKMLPDFRKTAIVSAFIISLIAILQAIQFYIFKDLTIPTYNGRIVGTLGNPNFLGGYLTMLLPFILWYPQRLKKKLFHAYKTVTVPMVLLAVFFTDSRSALLAIAVLFFIYGLRWYLKLNVSRTITFAIIAIIAIFLVLRFTDSFIHKNPVSFGNPTLVAEERGCRENWPQKYPWKFASDIFKNNSILLERATVCDNRLLMWTVGLQTVIKRPILGFGQENFEAIIPAGTMYKTDNAHNIFLETAISSGIIGLLFYLLILIYALRKASFDIKMSLLAFVIIGQFNPLSIAQISLFWILIGFSQRENNSK